MQTAAEVRQAKEGEKLARRPEPAHLAERAAGYVEQFLTVRRLDDGGGWEARLCGRRGKRASRCLHQIAADAPLAGPKSETRVKVSRPVNGRTVLDRLERPPALYPKPSSSKPVSKEPKSWRAGT